MRRLYIAVAEKVCALLDHVPSREEGRWYPGGYGCRLGISRHAVTCDERWGTDVWKRP